MAEDDLFRHAAAHGDREVRQHLVAVVRVAVALGQTHHHAQCTSARDDRGLVDRVGGFLVDRDDGVTGFVIGGHLLLVLGHDHGAAFGAHQDLVLGFLEVLHGDHALVGAGREQRRLIDQVGQVRAGEARRAAGDQRGVHVLGHGHRAHVHLEHLLAATDVRQRHRHLTVEAARAQQRRVQHVGTVGGGDHDHAVVVVETVHLHQQLVQGLLAFVMTAAQAGATAAADGVDLVDKDDAGGVLLGLIKHVTDPGRAHADEHFHEIGAGNAEERHLGFAGDGLGEQGLTGTRRADHQHTTGNLAAKTLEFGGITQELDQFLHFVLGLFHAGHVGEGGLDLVFAHQAGLGLAERHRPAAAFTAALHLAHEEDEDRQDQQNRQHGQEQLGQEALTLGFLTGHFHFVLDQRGNQVGVHRRRLDGLEAGAVVHLAGNTGVTDGDLIHIAVLHVIDERGVVQHLLSRLGVDAGGHYIEDPGDHQPQHNILGHVVQGRPRLTGRIRAY